MLPSCCTGPGPELAVFRETAGRARVFRVFHAAFYRRDSLNSFHLGKPPATAQGSVSFIGRQPTVATLSGSAPGRRNSESVVAAAISGQGNSSQTASLTLRWFGSPAGV